MRLMKAGLAADGYTGYFAPKRGKPDGCATFVKQGVSANGAHALYFNDGRSVEKDSGHVALLLIVQGLTALPISQLRNVFDFIPPSPGQ